MNRKAVTYSRRKKDQLIIGKNILNDRKRKRQNLIMAWLGYKKAYDMVPNFWIIECLKLVNVFENIIRLTQGSMAIWKTEITECSQTLREVEIKRRIFQSFSTVICYLYDTIVRRA